MDRPRALAVVPIISKAAEVGVRDHYTTASCSGSQKEMHGVSVRVMPDQAFYAWIVKLLMRLRLPPQYTVGADNFIEIVLALRPAECDKEYKISWTSRDLDQT